MRFAAALLLGKLAPGYLENHWSSSITLTGGKVAERLFPNYSVITAYAAGLQGATRGLALDLKPIRVNLVQPGLIHTEAHFGAWANCTGGSNLRNSTTEKDWDSGGSSRVLHLSDERHQRHRKRCQYERRRTTGLNRLF